MSSLTTKKAISYALKELLKEKPIDKVTINDISKKCDINRQTFYYHFQDLQDLVEWMCIKEVDDKLGDNKKYKTWEDKFLSIFELMLEEKYFIINIYHSISLEILRKSLYRLVYPIIYDELNNLSKVNNLYEQDKIFITNFYMYALVSVVLNWVEDNMKDDPNIIVEKVSILLTGTLEHACCALKNRKGV